MASRLHVIGPGSLGVLFATRLARVAGVTVIARTTPSSRLSPLLVDSQGQHTPAYTVESESSEDPLSTVLVTTKSYDTLKALRRVQHRFTPETRVILFQNGLQAQTDVLREFPQSTIYAAVTTEGANRRGNRVYHAGNGMTRLGRLSDNGPEAQELPLFALLHDAGFATEAATDIWRELWRKLSINCGINPFTALLDCNNGNILESGFFSERIDSLCRELSEVVTHAGHPESQQAIRGRIEAVATATGSNVSSMLQDIRRGNPTEIQAMNGFVCRYASRFRIPTPVNRELTEAVISLENRTEDSQP